MAHTENYTTVYVKPENQAKVREMKDKRIFSQCVNEWLRKFKTKEIATETDFIITMTKVRDALVDKMRRLDKIAVPADIKRTVIEDYIEDLKKTKLVKNADKKLRNSLIKEAKAWSEIGSLNIEGFMASMRLYYNMRGLEIVVPDWQNLRIAEEMKRGEGELGSKETKDKSYRPKKSTEETVADEAKSIIDKIDRDKIIVRDLEFFTGEMQPTADAAPTPVVGDMNQKDLDEETIEQYRLIPEEKAEVAKAMLNPVVERGTTKIPRWMIKHWGIDTPKKKKMIIEDEEMPDVLYGDDNPSLRDGNIGDEEK